MSRVVLISSFTVVLLPDYISALRHVALTRLQVPRCPSRVQRVCFQPLASFNDITVFVFFIAMVSGFSFFFFVCVYAFIFFSHVVWVFSSILASYFCFHSFVLFFPLFLSFIVIICFLYRTCPSAMIDTVTNHYYTPFGNIQK